MSTMESSSRQNEIDSARTALLQVAERLSSLSSIQRNVQSTQHAPISVPSTSGLQPGPSTSLQQSSNPKVPKAVNVTNAAIEAHRRLFNYSGGKGGSKGKKGKSRVSTCSLKFMCMSSCSDEKPPTSIKERTLLSNEGLGDAIITFDLDGDSTHCHGKLLEKFPKLATSGYQLSLYHRGGEDSSFCPLKPPYTPRKLKEVAGQCKIFIKPLQKDLIEKTSDETTPEVFNILEDDAMDDWVEPEVSCIICNATLKMSSVNEHHATVHNKPPVEKKRRTLDNNEESSVWNSPQKSALADLVPTATCNEIDTALIDAFGDVHAAAHSLLGLTDNQTGSEDVPSCSGSCTTPSMTQEKNVDDFNLSDLRKRQIDESVPRQLFKVSRAEGSEELKRDILTCYKRPDCNLNAQMRVCFEGEEGAGSGPIREFLLCAMRIVEEGFGVTGRKAVIFFEGEDDHKVPIHDQALRCTGAFRAIGRIIGHSVLHGGPCVYGLSPAVKQYWAVTGSKSEIDTEALSIVLEDISDIELRQYICELQELKPGELPSHDLKQKLEPYFFEAGIDMDRISSDWKLAIQGIMLYFVIDKRRRELDDMAKGMNEVGLHSLLGRCSASTVETIFPLSAMKNISTDQMKEAFVFEESEGNEKTIAFFFQYVDYLGLYAKDQPSILDLCCFWSGTNTLPSRGGSLLVKFDDGTNELPFAETCFTSLTLPTMHDQYSEFRKYMDIALNYGSLGIDHM